MFRTRGIIGLAALALVAGCAVAPMTPASMSSAVTKAQSVYADFKVAAGTWVLAHPSAKAGVAAIEAKLDPEIAGLSSAVAPTSIQAVIADLSNAALNLPPGIVSPALQAQIDGAALLAQGGLAFMPPTTAPPAASAPAVLAPAAVPAAALAPPPAAPAS